MNGRDFLVVAQDLLRGATEAAWRSAVSRAYYAAFHVARQLLEDVGFNVPPDEKAHAYLWLRLSNSGDPQVDAAGRDLIDLRRSRNRADYVLKNSLSLTMATNVVREAERIVQILEAASSSPARSQIATTIQVYERDVLKQVTWLP